jgi:hypothetical protein
VKLLILLLLPITLLAQTTDTSYQMVYYYKDFYKHKKGHTLWIYTSYDLWWEDDSGIGVTFILPNKRKKKRHAR